MAKSDQPGFGGLDLRNHVIERHVTPRNLTQIAQVGSGTGSVMRPVVSSSTPCAPSRRACMANLVS